MNSASRPSQHSHDVPTNAKQLSDGKSPLITQSPASFKHEDICTSMAKVSILSESLTHDKEAGQQPVASSSKSAGKASLASLEVQLASTHISTTPHGGGLSKRNRPSHKGQGSLGRVLSSEAGPGPSRAPRRHCGRLHSPYKAQPSLATEDRTYTPQHRIKAPPKSILRRRSNPPPSSPAESAGDASAGDTQGVVNRPDPSPSRTPTVAPGDPRRPSSQLALAGNNLEQVSADVEQQTVGGDSGHPGNGGNEASMVHEQQVFGSSSDETDRGTPPGASSDPPNQGNDVDPFNEGWWQGWVQGYSQGCSQGYSQALLELCAQNVQPAQSEAPAAEVPVPEAGQNDQPAQSEAPADEAPVPEAAQTDQPAQSEAPADEAPVPEAGQNDQPAQSEPPAAEDAVPEAGQNGQPAQSEPPAAENAVPEAGQDDQHAEVISKAEAPRHSPRSCDGAGSLSALVAQYSVVNQTVVAEPSVVGNDVTTAVSEELHAPPTEQGEEGGPMDVDWEGSSHSSLSSADEDDDEDDADRMEVDDEDVPMTDMTPESQPNHTVSCYGPCNGITVFQAYCS